MTPNAQALHDNVIEPVLFLMDRLVGSHDQAVPLLLGTAATESHFEYRRQIGGGPALGLWQMEPATEGDIHINFLSYNKKLRELVDSFRQDRTPNELKWNDAYACAMARIHYLRVPKLLPQVGDLQGQAEYWKQYYNTPLGKGSKEKYLKDWQTYVEGT